MIWGETLEIIIIILGIFIDRVTKIFAVNKLGGGNSVNIIDNIFSLEYLENQGAAFGVFQGKQIFLIILTLTIVTALIIYLFKYSSKSIFERAAISLIIGGAIGNLYDRIVYNYVVDFIKFQYFDKYTFPTFNFADICICVGTFLLLLYLLKDVRNERA